MIHNIHASITILYQSACSFVTFCLSTFVIFSLHPPELPCSADVRCPVALSTGVHRPLLLAVARIEIDSQQLADVARFRDALGPGTLPLLSALFEEDGRPVEQKTCVGLAAGWSG